MLAVKRWAYQFPTGNYAYDDKDRTTPMLFLTKRAALAWDEAPKLKNARLVRVQVAIENLL